MVPYPVPIPTLARAAKLLLAVLVLTSCAGALAQEASSRWEMRVCAQPDAYPISSSERPGFENRIAAILAEHLGADLSFEWTRVDATGIRDTLQVGRCDVVMGAVDGATGLTTTVPYYRAPYVFVYPSDASFDVDNLNDEILSELVVAVEPNGIAQLVLGELGLSDSTVTVAPPDVTSAGTDRLTNLLSAIEEGRADLTIAYGPDASALARRGRFQVVPVQPEFLPPFHQLYRSLAIGVRTHDDAFRDVLNVALSETWDEIQTVLEEYEVPQLSVVRPSPPALEVDETLVGAVLPMPSGRPAITDVMGGAAREGALVAESLLTSDDTTRAGQLRVLPASAPSAEAAVRAAERLLATTDIVGFIGGVGEGQAAALSRVAQRSGVPFLNVGDDRAELRSQCNPSTFHVIPSSGMYLQSALGALVDRGVTDWYVVVEDSDEGRSLYEQVTTLFDSGGYGSLAGTAEVPVGPAPAGDVLADIDASGANGVLLLMSPAGQEFFFTQYDLEATITGYPHPVMQTRDYIARFRQVLPDSGRLRVAAWDTTLTEDGAQEFNEAVVGRSGEPADPTSWSAFAAVAAIYTAVVETGSTDPGALRDHLNAEETSFRALKGEPLSFGPGRQLSQPLYLISIDKDAPFHRQVSARLGLAAVVDELPTVSAMNECVP